MASAVRTLPARKRSVLGVGRRQLDHVIVVVVVSAAGCTSRLGVMRPEAHARPFESLPSRAYYMPAVLPMEVGQ